MLRVPIPDGKTFIRELRTWSNAPVVVLSAREREEEKVEALDAGADDYLTKPFGEPELLARVHAQLRRAVLLYPNRPASPVVHFGDVRVDMATYEVTKGGEAVHLTPTAFRLLDASPASSRRMGAGLRRSPPLHSYLYGQSPTKAGAGPDQARAPDHRTTGRIPPRGAR
jgi:DNA-binding response OmpR family regulator